MIRWHAEPTAHGHCIEITHAGGLTVMVVECDVDGDTYYLVSGPMLDDDDMEDLIEDRMRDAGSQFGPISARYRMDPPS